jgi:TrmH family RNA methyltransferase
VTPLSASNARVKEARKLSRRSVRTERRLFLAEGWKALAEAAAVDGCVVEVFATEDAASVHHAMLAGLDAPVHLVEPRAAAALSDAVTSQGLVAVCRFLDVGTFPATDLAVICADVRDPGNAGAVIRCADAVGAGAVVLAGESVDPYNPKTVRASVGSLFHVPIVRRTDPAAAVAEARAAGLRVLAADGAGEVDLFAAGDLLTGRVAWLFGNEAWGLPADLAALADHRVAIPIRGRAESLNLATAAAVCLYASAGAAARMGR